MKSNFEHCYYIPVDEKEWSKYDINPKIVNRHGVYKDVYKGKKEYRDYQLRPNFPIAMTVAPDLFDPQHALIALEAADSLSGEAAARLGVQLAVGEVYVEGGLRHEFLHQSLAEVSGLTFSGESPGSVGFMAGGVSLMLFDKVRLGLEATYAAGEEAQEVTADLQSRAKVERHKYMIDDRCRFKTGSSS